MPISRLKDVTEGRLRISLLESSGYRNVWDVSEASEWNLMRIPGVGEQTARQAIAAARQLRAGAIESVRIRFDTAKRPREQAQLLGRLRRYDDLSTLIAPAEDDLAALGRRIGPLVEAAAPAVSRLKFRFTFGARKQAALAAVASLQGLLSSSEVTQWRGLLIEVERTADRTLTDAELWKDYERRAARYNSVLGEVLGSDLDVDAAQGHLPKEIAERVEACTLDTGLLTARLRGYQAFGAKFALVQQRVILGDEMGLGKTVQAIAAMAHLHTQGATHFLTVCPASVVLNWLREVRVHSRLEPFRLHGNERAHALRAWAAKGGVAVTTFDTLRSLDLTFGGPPIALLVVDEAHFVKNRSTKRAEAMLDVADRSERVLFLSGTPMENRVEELQSLVDYLQPDVASSLGDRRTLLSPVAFRNAVAPAYLRRNQADVLVELPERLEMDEWVELSTSDHQRYYQAVQEQNFMAMRRAAYLGDSSAKLQRLVELVEESAVNDWKVVVFSYFCDVLGVVHSTLGDVVFGPISGSVPAAERQLILDAFSAEDGHAVLVAQIEAGGVGLNMQAASVAILTEPQWKPSVEDQAVARLHRMGQTRRVHVHRLLARDSVDQRMLEIVHHKRVLFDEYVRTSAVTEAAPGAIDLSDVEKAKEIGSEAEAARIIIELECQRLGLAG
jgi:SNF2 family DNA or RNA helicase